MTRGQLTDLVSGRSPSGPSSLFLIGPRCVGKSSAGRRAALRLGLPFVDTDALIERRTRCSIPALFELFGEAFFRAVEEQVMEECFSRGGEVVATGGGCVATPSIRRRLRSRPVLWLLAPVEVLRERLRRAGGRPPIHGLDPAAELEFLVHQRRGYYDSCATRRVETGVLSLAEVSHVIEQSWSDLTHHHLR